ncbi:MAG: deoxyuridine 5'-triphosphate nucleotidohydrolase [Candidatus Omnitrophica bacterium]|nr:deoxyuridine 5'-triphosphate nucleotidohydrolase [Candidatus Omnitrophota bacterium]
MIKELIVEQSMICGFRNLEIQLQPNGFDLTINIHSLTQMNTGFFAPVPEVDFDNSNRKLPKLMRELVSEKDTCLGLTEGVYGFEFNEFLNLPNNIMAECKPRSTMLRCFCDVKNSYWDRGFSGKSFGLLVVYNHCVIHENARIAQMKFEMLEDDGNVYNGIYL